MMAPQAATCFRQWVILPEKCSGADAIMQAEMNRDIISAPCLTTSPATRARWLAGRGRTPPARDGCPPCGRRTAAVAAGGDPMEAGFLTPLSAPPLTGSECQC